MVSGVPAVPRLIGRHEEYARLRTLLSSAASARGARMVFVRGEAGIGKTRLVNDVTDAAKTTGGLVLSGRCIDLVGAGIAYLALSDAFFPIRQTNPELTRLTSELDRPANLESARSRVFHELRSALETLASTQSTTLVVEDLQWADTSTLDALTYLAHTMHNPAVTIVGTYRTDNTPTTSAALADCVTELLRSHAADVIDLRPLSDDDVRTLLQSASARIPDHVTNEIVARCGGNPFFAEELLTAATTGGGALPDVLRHVLLSRVAGLSDETRAVLETVAAAGRPVSYDLLSATTGLTDAGLQQALRAASEARVLLSDADAYRFRHALQAEAIASTLLPGQREQLHRRIARAFDKATRQGTADISAAELAEQWAMAGEPAAALIASVAAARESVAAAGLAEGLRHLLRAIDLWASVRDAGSHARIDYASLLIWAAELADLTGRGRRAAQLIREVIDHLGPDVPRDRLGGLYERLGTYLLPVGDRQAGLAAFRTAVDTVPDEPASPARARALAGLGTALMLSYRHAESRETCEQARDVAEEAGDEATAARAEAVLGLDLCYLGDPMAGRETLADARRRASKAGAPREVTHSDVLLCDLLVTSGQLAEAAQVARDGLRYAEEAGLGRGYGLVLAGYAAEALLELGSWEESDALLTAVLRDDAAYWAHYPHLVRAELAILRGDFDGASRHATAGARAAAEPTSSIRHGRVLAELAIWTGHPGEALDTIARLDVAAWHAPRLAAVAMRAAADAANGPDGPGLSSGDPMLRPAQQLLGQAAHEQANLAFLGDLGAAWYKLALAEQARLGGDDPAAWHAAYTAWTARQHPFLSAYCGWRWAEADLLHGAGTTSVAERVRTSATSAYSLEARPLLERIHLLAKRTRIDLLGLRAEHAAELAHALGLTTREGEVLSLVAQGHTNREIADELHISPKTASVHVTHILRKLDVPRRSDAAAIAHRLSHSAVATSLPPTRRSWSFDMSAG